MASRNLNVDLTPRKDQDGNTYYIGRLAFPGVIDCKDGVVFLVFTSDNGNEQLQIAPQDKKGPRDDYQQ